VNALNGDETKKIVNKKLKIGGHFSKSTNFQFSILKNYKNLKHANLEKLKQRAWMGLNLYSCQDVLNKVILVLKTLKVHY
jgi:hypothetical protein